jgi:NADH-quinone oxidoreductase subunit F
MNNNGYPKIVHKWINVPNIGDIDVYIGNGGYEGFKKALTMKPEEIIAEVKASGLRGRGGAGFPTGVKWELMDKRWQPRYVVANDDEAEPCTFKDRELTEKLPHQIVEGVMIASYALGVNKAFIYIRGEFVRGREGVWKAIRECHAKGLLGKNILGSGFDLDIVAHPGAGAYICGEETALLNSLQGDRAYPRMRPPFPGMKGGGAYGQPTVVNNVETLSTLPHIILGGAKWYTSIGVPGGAGTRVYSVAGHVQKPGNYELPLSVTLQEVIDVAGGLFPGRKLKAVIPGGSSMPWFTDKHLSVGMDFESIQNAGSFGGSGSVVVMDDTTCVVKAAWRLAHFYKHESCGWCTPCREGTDWLEKICLRVERGEGKEGDIELLLDMVDNINGQRAFGTERTFCLLGPSCGAPVRSSIELFRDEWQYHIQNKRCLVDSQ